jgi:hypothetical protein
MKIQNPGNSWGVAITLEDFVSGCSSSQGGGRNVPCECKHEDEEGVVDGGSGIRSLEGGADHVTKSTREHQEDPDEEEGAGATAMKIPGVNSVLLETDWVVPAEETQDTHQL